MSGYDWEFIWNTWLWPIFWTIRFLFIIAAAVLLYIAAGTWIMGHWGQWIGSFFEAIYNL